MISSRRAASSKLSGMRELFMVSKERADEACGGNTKSDDPKNVLPNRVSCVDDELNDKK